MIASRKFSMSTYELHLLGVFKPDFWVGMRRDPGFDLVDMGDFSFNNDDGVGNPDFGPDGVVAGDCDGVEAAELSSTTSCKIKIIKSINI